MSGKLEPGCLARVIETVMGQHVGEIVSCIRILGEHSGYGVVWEVRAQRELTTEYGGKGHIVHVPAKWLKKIEPPPLPDKVKELDMSPDDLVEQ